MEAFVFYLAGSLIGMAIAAVLFFKLILYIWDKLKGRK